MFGYATKETENYMPLALDLSHKILEELAEIRKNETDLISYLSLMQNLKLLLNILMTMFPKESTPLLFQHNMTILMMKAICWLKSKKTLLKLLFQE